MKNLGQLIMLTIMLSVMGVICIFGVAAMVSTDDRRTPTVDAHLHLQPFGGHAIEYDRMVGYLRDAGIKTAVIQGIGQRVPIGSDCEYYLDCPGTPVLPTVKNDFINAENFVKRKPDDIEMIISMTFMDLTNPEEALRTMNLLCKEYPGVFKWMGEINLHKEALMDNGFDAPFFDEAYKFIEHIPPGMPITIHSDFHKEYTFDLQGYLYRRPDVNFVWAHMGMSREGMDIPTETHLLNVESMLKEHPNLYIDLSWSVLADYMNKDREKYVNLINNYSDRFIYGSDFVAAQHKNLYDYKKELEVTSDILQDVSEEAWENIGLGKNLRKILGDSYGQQQ